MSRLQRRTRDVRERTRLRRFTILRSLRVILVVAMAWTSLAVAWAQPSTVVPPGPIELAVVEAALTGLDLPASVLDEALASAARALERPALRAQGARVAEAAEAARPRLVPEWSLDPGLSLAWDGSVGAGIGLGLRLPIVSPARDRERLEAASAARRSRLEVELRAREAAQDVVEARLALWRLSRQLRLAVDAGIVAAAAPADPARRAARLARLEPDIRFERHRLRVAIARAAGTDHVPEVADAAWSPLLARQELEACPDGSMNVRLASEALRAAVASDRAAFGSTPSVTLGASTDVRSAELGTSAPAVEASLWLTVGLPAEAPAAGRLEARADRAGLRVNLHARSDRGGSRGGWRPVAVARADLDEARFGAHERAAQALHELASTRAGLDRLDDAARPGSAVDRLERSWERADLEARLAAIVVHLGLDCASRLGTDAGPDR